MCHERGSDEAWSCVACLREEIRRFQAERDRAQESERAMKGHVKAYAETADAAQAALAQAQRERDEVLDQYVSLAELVYGEAEWTHEGVHRRIADAIAAQAALAQCREQTIEECAAWMRHYEIDQAFWKPVLVGAADKMLRALAAAGDPARREPPIDLDRASIRTGCETERNRRADQQLRALGYVFDATEQRWVLATEQRWVLTPAGDPARREGE